MINASPDLRAQIDAFSSLHPSQDSSRNSPIDGVLLTNADLDHVLGLFLLRERSSLCLHASQSVFQVLTRDLHLADILNPFCRLDWREPPGTGLDDLLKENGRPSGLHYRALPLSTKLPPFSSGPAPDGPQSVAYEIVDDQTGGRLVVAPDVATITTELLLALSDADAVLFDGTFWSPDELEKATGKSRSAEDMGHLPIGAGSLGVLSSLKARHKIYLHINNTNPIFSPRSSERALVERAGATVGFDGLEFEL